MNDPPSPEDVRGILRGYATHDELEGGERDKWIRLFNRLQGAVSHHRNADRFKDDHDEALYAAMDRILKEAAR